MRICCEYNRAVVAPMRLSDALRRQFRDAELAVQFEHDGSLHSAACRPLQYCETRPAYADITDGDLGHLRHWVRMVVADLDGAPMPPLRLSAMDPTLRDAMIEAVEEAGSAWLREAYACRHADQAILAWIVRVWRAVRAAAWHHGGPAELTDRTEQLALPAVRRTESTHGVMPE